MMTTRLQVLSRARLVWILSSLENSAQKKAFLKKGRKDNHNSCRKHNREASLQSILGKRQHLFFALKDPPSPYLLYCAGVDH
jgi:hypothetical protein